MAPRGYAGRSNPYVVVLFSSSIDVFNAEKQTVVQTIPFEGGGAHLVWPSVADNGV